MTTVEEHTVGVAPFCPLRAFSEKPVLALHGAFLYMLLRLLYMYEG